jgi:TonB family protein
VLDATASGRETRVLDLTGSPPTAPARTAAGAPPNPIPVPETAQPAAPPKNTGQNTGQNAEPGQVAIYRNPKNTPVAPVPNQSATRQPTASGVLPAQQPPVDAKANAAKSDKAPDVAPAGSPQQTGGPQLNAAAQPPAAGSTINGWDSSAPAIPRPAAPETTTPAPAAAPENKPPVFGPPKPLLQVMPNTRALAPGVITQVTRVEVAVRIDNIGRVMSAHVLNESGSSKGALSQAAVAAARQWTFQPATLQGEKVESEHTIVFEFRPENQQ